ncbi:MAG: tRNA dihydrouridine synthase DusB [Alphaproteobacteria bacterium]|nr:tRNA dihydrouridine synthase DusB [Alphaproteobacteria bacterium]
MAIKLAEILLDPPVFLAPLAGITDLPFRNLVSRFGAGLVVSEMVASQEMVQARPSAKVQSRQRAELGLDRDNTAVQIAGNEAHWMAECARIITGNGARIIDINMGCPAKKVTSGYSGSALMKDLDHAVRLVEAVVAAVDVPVTLKTRLGWDHDCLNAAELGRRAQEAGVQMLTIHGRTRCQFYKGRADWGLIGDVVNAVTIPVIANGDIVDSQSAETALRLSGAAGVMVGRGAQGAPWQLAEIAADLFDRPAPDIPEGAALCALIEGHFEDMLAYYGIELGRKVARKHLGWYMDRLATPRALRREVLTAPAPEKVKRLIRSLADATPLQAVA